MNKLQLRQLIREEIKKSVNEGKDFKKDKYGNHLEPQFKKGDKVTYLGNKGVITNVNKEMGGTYSYDVSYDKGSGKTKASNIYNKDGKTIQLESINEDQEFLRARDEIENDKNKAKKLASLMAPGDDMLQQAAQFGPYEVLQVGADAIGSGSEDMYAYDGVFTQYDFMLMFKKAGYSNEAIEILMDDDYVQRLERG